MFWKDIIERITTQDYYFLEPWSLPLVKSLKTRGRRNDAVG